MHKTENTVDFYCVHGTHRSEFFMRTEQIIVLTYTVHIIIYFAGSMDKLTLNGVPGGEVVEYKTQKSRVPGFNPHWRHSIVSFSKAH